MAKWTVVTLFGLFVVTLGYKDFSLEWKHDFAANYVPTLQFDGGAEDHCFPDWAEDANDESCKDFNPEAPLYYEVRQCGTSLKIIWWIWYGWQVDCVAGSGSHGNDWEHITMNFLSQGGDVLDASNWQLDSATFHQHNGWYTRKSSDPHPKVYIGKNAHGSYDNWCDGVGFVWEQDYCAGGCGYWDDYRNSQDEGWITDNIQHVSIVSGNVANRIKDEKYFANPELNSCAGPDIRCVSGPCGCWRNDHTFPVEQACDW